MKTLVYLDDEDKKNWQEVLDIREKVINGELLPIELKKATNSFWHNTIDKYRVLYNKKISLNTAATHIFEWGQASDLSKYH